MNTQENGKQTGLKKSKKSRKKDSLIGLTITFSDESSSYDPVEETVEDNTVSDDSLFTSEEMEKEDLGKSPSPKRRKSKKLKKTKSSKSLKSRKDRASRRASAPLTTEVCQSNNPSENNMKNLSNMIRLSMNKIEKERSLLQQKEQETSQLLETERSMNAELQCRIMELENKNVDEPPRNSESDELILRIKMLEAENELLKQKTQRQEQVIINFAVDQQSKIKQESKIKRRLSIGSAASEATMSSCLSSLRAFLDDVSERSHGEPWESLEESFDSFRVSPSSIPSGAKAQGEILQLRSTLGRTTKAYEKQAEELSSLKQEVEELRKHLGLNSKDTSGTKQRSPGVPISTDRSAEIIISRPSLQPVFRLSQSDLSQPDLSQLDVNDMTRPRDLTNLLD